MSLHPRRQGTVRATGRGRTAYLDLGYVAPILFGQTIHLFNQLPAFGGQRFRVLVGQSLLGERGWRLRVDECGMLGVSGHAEQCPPFAGRQIREIVLFGHDLSFFRLFAAGVMGLQFGPIIRPRVPVVARVLAVQGEQDARGDSRTKSMLRLMIRVRMPPK